MGLAMARAIAQAGAAVAVLGRTRSRVDEAAAELREMGAHAFGLSAEVRDPSSIAAAFEQTEAELGPVSMLANNAGANFPALAERMSANAWRAITQIAIDGTFLCSAEFARRRIAAGQGGAIVNNSAQYVWSGFAGDAHSAAAKSAIVRMTRVMARDWAPYGIRVNCVAAGFFPHARAIGTDREPGYEDRLGTMIPVGRVGRMREFGWAGALMVSPLMQGITGETLIIDGADRLRRQLMHPAFEEPRLRAELWGTAP